jgi:myo-inositol-1(or 4)-monophosphatase
MVLALLREAGDIAMSFYGRAHDSWEKGPGQIVTEADIAVDRFLQRGLSGLAPDAGWLSEESVDDASRLGADRVWVVDPIDGTRSFAQARPEFTICIGLVERERPVLGLVYNPATGELFQAVAGQGASLNGRPIHASERRALGGATVVVSKFENRKRNFASLLPGADITTIGSLAYKLCLVACGRYDGYLTWRRTHDWDIAAAAMILTEAGALMTDPDGGTIRLNRPEPRHPGIVAANPELHAAILAATRKARTEFVRRP